MSYIHKDTEAQRELLLPKRMVSVDKEAFIQHIKDFLETEHKRLVLNFEETLIIDSAGLGYLLVALTDIKKSDKELVLKNPKEYVEKSFYNMNYHSIFNIQKDPD